MNDRCDESPNEAGALSLADAAAVIAAVRAEITRCIVGMETAIDLLLCALLAERHVLVEGVPGLGKTMLVSTLARTIGGAFRRIQFTADLLPADILGGHVYNQRRGEFTLRRGPIFAQFILADEINRAAAKTQSALLEVMQERQVTIEGETIPVDRPFFVFATQNPLEHEGVYPLPQAQLDRFAMRIIVDYPKAEAEFLILALHRTALPQPRQIVDTNRLIGAQCAVERVSASDAILNIIVSLATATRTRSEISLGAGPRLGIDLLGLARARALLDGRDHVIPDDLKAMFPAVANHRLVLSPQAEIGGVSTLDVIHEIIRSTTFV